MRSRKYDIYMADFETTVYKGQTDTEVWAAACVKLFTEDVQIFHSIAEQYEYFVNLKQNIIVYYHNLKFDGSFWLDYLLRELQYEQSYTKADKEDVNTIEWVRDRYMKNKTFRYSISDKGQWYNIIIKINDKIIEIRDSLKLLPFSVKRIGQSFGTKHKKLDMEYEGFRYAGCEITDKEKEYIGNDVLVVKEALEIMLNEGHTKTTIGSCCLEEFKQGYSKNEYDSLFPDQYQESLDRELYGYTTVGDYVHKSYKGGWCYLVKGKENQIRTNGVTADVNSLYPSMMSSESGNKYPVGKATFWKGNYIPENILDSSRYYYFIRIKTRFYIKQGYLPFIQIKGTWKYTGTEALESSDIYDKETGRYMSVYKDMDGKVHDTRVVLTLTCTDYILFREHYNVVDFEILDGCYYSAMSGIFDEYIDKYKKIKVTSKGAKRELAKLFLNNLYGKMASNTDSSFKVAYLKEDKTVAFFPVDQSDKKPGYIPVGSAITSYARNFTIRAAQKNFHGANERGFIYADTDSIHCDLDPSEVVGIKVHTTDFCCWKLESSWDKAIFVRQKTYIEHVIAEDLQPIEQPYNNIKCAGMPDKCKDLFQKSMDGYEPKSEDKYTEEELEFLKTKRDYSDFKVGLKIPGKLMPKRIRGGILLVSTSYEMHKK